jgi:hypothetical protein
MIVVIQCAAGKQSNAGHLLTASGRPVDFVTHPQAAPHNMPRAYARPDDLADGSETWRKLLLEDNRNPEGNPLGLYPAYRLYKNRIYRRLVERLGVEKVFILSAGWGLIRADFLTPSYDITFSKNSNVPAYKRRAKSDRYEDFRMVPEGQGDDLVFFGGKDYVPRFCALTSAFKGRRTVFHRVGPGRPPSAGPQIGPGCAFLAFETPTMTNLHYECANAFLEGSIRVC